VLKLKKKILYIPDKNPHPAYHTFYTRPPSNLILKFNEKNNNLNKNFKEHAVNKRKISEYINTRFKAIEKIENILRVFYNKIFDLFNIPIIIPLLHIKRDYDYLLSPSLVLANKKYILYVESIASIVGFKDRILNSRLSLKIIKKFLLSKRCKYVFNWSKSSKKILIDVLKIPINKQNKFKTIYPSIEPIMKIERNDSLIYLFFVSSINKNDKEYNFYMKGGKLVLQAYEILKRKYDNLKLIFIGFVPEQFINYYKKIPDINFYLRVPYKKVLKFYEQSDIFLFPTYGDTFGFTFLEAMAHGLPIITIDNNSAATELVLNNKTGFLIDTSQKFLKFPHKKYCPEWVAKWKFYENLRNEDDLIGLRNLVEKLERLIQDKDLREKFGENGKERLISGNLSIKHRNRKLYDLFND